MDSVKKEKDKKEKDPKEKRLKRKVTTRDILIVILLAIIIILLLFLYFRKTAPADANQPGIIWDNNATTSNIETMTKEEIEAMLNEKVKQTELNMSMNTAPEFESGDSTGILNIYNDEVNNYPQKVAITLDSDGSTLYESNAIPVGSRIIESKLDVKLEKGEYQCTAHFYALNPDTGEALGEGRVPIKITIKN